MKTNYRNMNLFFWGMIILLLWSCSPTTSATETASSELTVTEKVHPDDTATETLPYLTNTPHPTNTGKEGGWPFIPTIDFTTIPTPIPPLQPHEWQTETVLVEFGHVRGGDGGWTIARGSFVSQSPPALILYSTGQIINTVAKDGRNNQYQFDYHSATLSRQESCQILNTIDQMGFLTFDDIGFNTLAMGAPGNYIKANAWQSSEVNQQALHRFVECINNYEQEGFLGCGFISNSTSWRAVVDTYNFLENYEPPRLEKHVPQEYIVWVNQPDYDPWEISEWPFAFPSLRELEQTQTCERKGWPFTLETNEISIAWQVDPPTGFYEQDGFILEVYSRPKLPHEIVSDCTGWPQIAYEEITPANTMSCSPEDGVLPIPEIP